MTELLKLTLLDPEVGVPADDFARALAALQKLVHATALAAQPTLRPNAEFRRRFELRLGSPDLDGLWSLKIGPRQMAMDLQLGTSPRELHERLEMLFEVVAETDDVTLCALFPEPGARRKVLREVQKLLPRGVERWEAVLAFGDRPARHLGQAQARWVEEHVASLTVSGPLMMTVTGELVGVDFDRGTYSFRYAPTGRILDGRYAPEEEVQLLKSRRKLIHVSGEYVLDEEDHPTKLKRALKVTVVDLSSLTLNQVRLEDGSAYALVPPLVLTPAMDAASQQLYEVEDESLELHIAAPTREQLESELVQRVAELAASPSKAWRRRLKPLVGSPE